MRLRRMLWGIVCVNAGMMLDWWRLEISLLLQIRWFLPRIWCTIMSQFDLVALFFASFGETVYYLPFRNASCSWWFSSLSPHIVIKSYAPWLLAVIYSHICNKWPSSKCIPTNATSLTFLPSSHICHHRTQDGTTIAGRWFLSATPTILRLHRSNNFQSCNWYFCLPNLFAACPK